MRVLHVVPHVLDVGNGIVNATIDLACEQSRQGHQVCIASGGGEWETLLAAEDVRHEHLDLQRNVRNLVVAAAQVRRLLQDRPDVVHAHTVTAALLVRGAAPRSGPPLITTVHNEFARAAPLMAVGDRVIAVSNAVARGLRRRRVPAHKLRVVPNGTLRGARARAAGNEVPEPLEHLAVVTVAGMFVRKGIADLVEAFAVVAGDVPAAHLYLVGDGPDRTRFEQQARRTAFADRIHFVGYQRAPRRYLVSADVFVLASRSDPMPLVIPEARDAGCAIIGSDADGIPEALDFGRAGYVFPAGDVAALVKALRLLVGDAAVRRCWRDAGQRNLAWLRIDRVAADTLQVYGEVIGD